MLTVDQAITELIKQSSVIVVLKPSLLVNAVAGC